MTSLFGKLYFLLPNSQRLERIWKIAHIDFKKRYYDSFMGLFWAFLNPAFRILIYYFIFTTFYDAGSRIENFALYLYSGLISFLFFKEIATSGMMIFSQKRYLIESIQFNKIDLFISNGLSCSMGFLFNLFVFFILAMYFGIEYSWRLIYFVPIFFTIWILGLGAGIILSIIRIYFKDVIHLWNMFSLLLFWSCPIFFRGEAILEKVPYLMYINPMAGVIYNVRPVLMYDSAPDWYWMGYNALIAIVVLIVGLIGLKYFTKKVLENL